MSNRYAKSFILTLFIYSAIATGYIAINSKLKTINNLTTKTISISIISEKRQESISQPLPVKKEKKTKTTKEQGIKQVPFTSNEKKIFTQNKLVDTKQELQKQQNKSVETKMESKTQQNSQSVNNVDNSKLKDNFLAKIKSEINANKIYPDVAKKRGIEGKVTAEFTITQNGEVTNINITSGNNALRGAVKSAIEKSFPQNVPYELKHLFPMTANITLNFNLVFEE